MRSSLDQDGAYLLLELAQLAAQGRLGHVKACRRLADAACIDYVQKQHQQIQVQAWPWLRARSRQFGDRFEQHGSPSSNRPTGIETPYRNTGTPLPNERAYPVP